MPLLDRQSLADATNRPALLDPGLYPNAYIAGVIADAHQEIRDFLRYDPVLAVVTGEEGAVELDTSGYYRSLYRLQLKHAPFIPGTAGTIFSALTLNYARSVQVDVAVNLAYATVQHTWARAFLSPGALSALAGMSFDLGGPLGALVATGYTASYVAGYATGINDPLGPGGVSYGAPPIPAAITQAAVLLCRERIALDDLVNGETALALGGINELRTADQQIRYQANSGVWGLGSGTPLSEAAANRLRRWQRTEIA